jgi:uncharacterized protein (DUF433 family)
VVEVRPQSQLIVRVPGLQGGEPVIRGTRVPVRSIALAHHDDGLDARQIAEEFRVDIAAVEAALVYYDEHTVEIDRIIDRHERATHEA